MKTRIKQFAGALILAATASWSFGQNSESVAPGRQAESSIPPRPKGAVIITGARFSYKLVQQWIDDFNKQFPDIQVVIESRGSSDPDYDILAEVYEHDEEVKKNRAYLYVARYAVVPVATSTSLFAKTYEIRGLNNNMIKQIFFHNVFADKEEEQKIKVPFTLYTRFQKAGAAKVFANHYGFEQKDILGKAIVGSDEHVLKAILRDTTGVSHLPLPVVYRPETKDKVDGLSIIPLDLDGNGRVRDDEREAFKTVERLLNSLEDEPNQDLPIAHFHLSVLRENVNPDAVTFLKWIAENGESYLHRFGFLKPASNNLETQRFLEFPSERGVH